MSVHKGAHRVGELPARVKFLLNKGEKKYHSGAFQFFFGKNAKK